MSTYVHVQTFNLQCTKTLVYMYMYIKGLSYRLEEESLQWYSYTVSKCKPMLKIVTVSTVNSGAKAAKITKDSHSIHVHAHLLGVYNIDVHVHVLVGRCLETKVFIGKLLAT